jgi:hypothetical protein
VPHFGFTHLCDPLSQRRPGDLPIARVQHERIDGQVQANHQPDRPRQHLRGDGSAGTVGPLDHGQRVFPGRVTGVADGQRERHRQAGVGGGVENLVQHRLIPAGRMSGTNWISSPPSAIPRPIARISVVAAA